MHHWLVKQEPDSYAWTQFVADGKTNWEGVRNFQARNNLRAMSRGDSVLFYASGDTKAVLGVARVNRAAFLDATAEPGGGDWVAVELAAVAPLKQPVTLATIKATASLRETLLVRHSRLSVMPLTAAQFQAIVKLGHGTG